MSVGEVLDEKAGAARIVVPALRQLYGYWLSKRPDGALPRRADIDPTEFAAVLPQVFLMDVEPSPLRFRFRLIGTEVTRAAGRDHTGHYLDDPTVGADVATLAPQYRAVVERRRAMRFEQQSTWFEREFQRYEKIMMPLASDGATIDMLFCGLAVLRRA